MLRLNNVLQNLKNIQKCIEVNDPNEKLSWLNDVYTNAEDAIFDVKNVIRRLEEFVKTIDS